MSDDQCGTCAAKELRAEVERLKAEVERLKAELERANDPTWPR